MIDAAARYRHGRDFEHQVRRHLEADGYWVIRAAGSKTKADLIAIKTGQFLVVQCKRSNEVRPAERTEVLRIAGLVPGGIPVVAWKQARVTTPQYRRLTGPGPQDWIPFLTDEAAA